MTPPAAEPAQGWVVRHTWTVDDPDMVHPRHTYRTKPSRGLAEDAAWDVSSLMLHREDDWHAVWLSFLPSGEQWGR